MTDNDASTESIAIRSTATVTAEPLFINHAQITDNLTTAAASGPALQLDVETVDDSVLGNENTYLSLSSVQSVAIKVPGYGTNFCVTLVQF